MLRISSQIRTVPITAARCGTPTRGSQTRTAMRYIGAEICAGSSAAGGLRSIALGLIVSKPDPSKVKSTYSIVA
jgi:hypothetical protein